MFNRFFILIVLLLLGSCKNSSIIKTSHGIIANISTGDAKNRKIEITILSPTVIKVATGKNDSILKSPSLIAAASIEEDVKFNVQEKNEYVEIVTDSLIVKLNLLSGNICYMDLSENLLLRENGKKIVQYHNDVVGNQNSIKQHFDWPKEEMLYGLGQHNQQDLSIRGKKITLEQLNTKVSIPVILSTEGYGIYWDNYSKSVFDDSVDNSYIASEIGDKIQYYFVKGTCFDQIINDLRRLTGKAPMVPRWVLGYIQSRNRYKSETELMNVVKRHRQLKIPLDAIILDYMHWGDAGFGSMTFDSVDFPNPNNMIHQLHENYNTKLIVSVWPSFQKDIPNWKLFNQDSLLLDLDLGRFGQVHDAFNPAAGKLYFDLVKKSYIDRGVDGIWFDATEPEKIDKYAKTSSYLGPTAKYLNLYSYFDMKNIYEPLKEVSENRVVILTRSAFLGQQKFGTIVWSGDIGTDFNTLKKQIPTGLNFCMTGIPYWNTDIGGYTGGDPNDPDYQEVFVRWFQYGSFTPFFRAHGRRHPMETRSGENEIWSYGPKNQEILTRYVNLRYRLLPYIYTLSHRVSNEGYTMMRSLIFDFMADKNTHKINDQFMFGDNILVCPVVEAGAEKRDVYLPKGVQWFDFWTGEKYDGGKIIEANAPLETIPLYIKAGSIIPMGDIMQYSTERFNDQIELRIYGDRDAVFNLYEDENDNYNYKNGKFSLIPIRYSADNNSIVIGPTKGEFEGMLRERVINIVKVKEKYGDGIEAADNFVNVPYNGEQIKINIE
ncbi:MAG: TIM-barrel domain-containing protein [Candidatus Cyclobacteriaceae bacterium M3_2C_046]